MSGRGDGPEDGKDVEPQDVSRHGRPRRELPVVPEPTSVDRRSALKILAAAAALPMVSCTLERTDGGGASSTPPPGNPLAAHTSTDPDLVDPEIPWELKLQDDEMATIRVLADLIIPADDRSPSAADVGVPDFVNEWVSAPYEAQRRDLIVVRGGLGWLDTESVKRHGTSFTELTREQQTDICDDIAYLPDARPEHRAGALFFDKLRDLVSVGFWTTEEGMADLGYVGNVAMARWDGPPPEILEELGLQG